MSIWGLRVLRTSSIAPLGRRSPWGSAGSPRSISKAILMHLRWVRSCHGIEVISAQCPPPIPRVKWQISTTQALQRTCLRRKERKPAEDRRRKARKREEGKGEECGTPTPKKETRGIFRRRETWAAKRKEIRLHSRRNQNQTNNLDHVKRPQGCYGHFLGSVWEHYLLLHTPDPHQFFCPIPLKNKGGQKSLFWSSSYPGPFALGASRVREACQVYIYIYTPWWSFMTLWYAICQTYPSSRPGINAFRRPVKLKDVKNLGPAVWDQLQPSSTHFWWEPTFGNTPWLPHPARRRELLLPGLPWTVRSLWTEAWPAVSAAQTWMVSQTLCVCVLRFSCARKTKAMVGFRWRQLVASHNPEQVKHTIAQRSFEMTSLASEN